MQMTPGPAKKKQINGFMLPDQAWHQALVDHQDRVTRMKPAIVIDEPWRALPKPRKPSRPSSARTPARSRPLSAKADAGGRAAGIASVPAALAPAAGGKPKTSPRPLTARLRGAVARAAGPTLTKPLESLTPDQQFLCEDFVDLLLTMSTPECQSIIEQVFVLAEERRLLRGYNGVFPGLAIESEMNAAGDARSSPQHAPADEAAADDHKTQSAAVQEGKPPARKAATDDTPNRRRSASSDDYTPPESPA
jgi:hypothetical protein